MNIDDIKSTGLKVLDLLNEYHNPSEKELAVDQTLFAYLSCLHSPVSRQHPIYLYGSCKPQRIDYRVGGSNPVVIEFALRASAGGGSLSVSQNSTELSKLCRISQTKAKLRSLLLLDLAQRPLDRPTLKESYNKWNAGRGRFDRWPVCIVYVHRDRSFHFSLNPFRAVA
jgi:hypothetical protein